MNKLKNKPVLLIIRDGWGQNHNPQHNPSNAIHLANTPIADNLLKSHPSTELLACGLDVGLPKGVMGNSEVGHQNIGAGRIVDQEIVRINKALSDPNFQSNPLSQAFTKKTVHLLGLISDAGVHSSLKHLLTLIELAKKANVHQLFIHAITDGRDTPPNSALSYITKIQKKCSQLNLGKIASISGRYFAMDRDHRWERTHSAYQALTQKNNINPIPDPTQIIENYYKNPSGPSQIGDEFIPPQPITDTSGTPIGPIQSNDAVIFFNFRGDRPRQLTQAFVDPSFNHFKTTEKNIFFTTLTDYKKNLCQNVIFPRKPHMENILGKVISDAAIPQFRCAETEKYPHVTFFFNDYRDDPFPLEHQTLIPSPKDVPTYDLKPEMSAAAVTQATKDAILSNKYGLIIVNFANPDMVGHTGSLHATIKAVETTDHAVGQLLHAIDHVQGVAIITADHGNADQMKTPSGPHTQHTLNPVPLTIYGKDCKLRPSGRLADIAPTILHLMGIPQPQQMTGKSLIS